MGENVPVKKDSLSQEKHDGQENQSAEAAVQPNKGFSFIIGICIGMAIIILFILLFAH